MWSAGIVLLNIIGGRNPFKGRSKEDTLEKIKKDKLSFIGNLFDYVGERWSGIGLDVK